MKNMEERFTTETQKTQSKRRRALFFAEKRKKETVSPRKLGEKLLAKPRVLFFAASFLRQKTTFLSLPSLCPLCLCGKIFFFFLFLTSTLQGETETGLDLFFKEGHALTLLKHKKVGLITN